MQRRIKKEKKAILTQKKEQLLHERIKKKKKEIQEWREIVYPPSSPSDLAAESSRRRRGCELGKKKRLSLLVLAAVAPAVHGGCGAERPIHPAHQGRMQHRKTGRKRGYSSWTHCLSV